MKNLLRNELGDAEWNLWIRHARLWRVLGGTCLLVVLPRKGRTIFGALRYYKRLRALARRMNFGLGLTVEEDLEARQLRREAIESLAPDTTQERSTNAAERAAYRVDLRRYHQLLEKLEKEQRFLLQPFLEDPPSELWKNLERRA